MAERNGSGTAGVGSSPATGLKVPASMERELFIIYDSFFRVDKVLGGFCKKKGGWNLVRVANRAAIRLGTPSIAGRPSLKKHPLDVF